MEAICCRLFASGLPVGIDDETLRWTQYLHAFVAAAEEHVVVPLGIAEEFVEGRSVDVPGGEDQAAIERHAGLLQTQLLLGHHLAVHALALDRRTDEVAVWAERPAVIEDRKSTRLNSSHSQISYAVF